MFRLLTAHFPVACPELLCDGSRRLAATDLLALGLEGNVDEQGTATKALEVAVRNEADLLAILDGTPVIAATSLYTGEPTSAASQIRSAKGLHSIRSRLGLDRHLTCSSRSRIVDHSCPLPSLGVTLFPSEIRSLG